jgi:LPXTG-site transpeptidase (sortase) family protein
MLLLTMKSLSIIFFKSALFIIPGILLLYVFGVYFPNSATAVTPDKQNTQSSTTHPTVVVNDMISTSPFKELRLPLHAQPVQLYSKEVELDVQINPVGVQADGMLDVPSDWFSGGWYKKSAKPGQEGNVIIDGHYDTNTGSPAAFWNLKNLVVNDKVVVVDEFGKEHAYVVEEIHHLEISTANRLDILNKSVGKTLTLITCGGVWDAQAGTYNKRLIIKARIIDSLHIAGKPA